MTIRNGASLSAMNVKTATFPLFNLDLLQRETETETGTGTGTEAETATQTKAAETGTGTEAETATQTKAAVSTALYHVRYKKKKKSQPLTPYLYTLCTYIPKL